MLKTSRDFNDTNVHIVVWVPIPDLQPNSQLCVAASVSVDCSLYSAAHSMQWLSATVNELPLETCLMTLIWCCVVRVISQGNANGLKYASRIYITEMMHWTSSVIFSRTTARNNFGRNYLNKRNLILWKWQGCAFEVNCGVWCLVYVEQLFDSCLHWFYMSWV